jgi:CheY-like chemotaxis protein
MTKVLLVEDDNNLREIYEARLAAEGYDIATAKDGEDALAVAKQEKPELIISDVMMPRISGFEMLDILRNTDGLKHTKVIMLTALGQAEDKSRADNLGADRYLVKSQVTLEDIVKAAQELLDPNTGTETAAQPTEAATPPASPTPAEVPVTATSPTAIAEPAATTAIPVISEPQPVQTPITPEQEIAVAAEPPVSVDPVTPSATQTPSNDPVADIPAQQPVPDPASVTTPTVDDSPVVPVTINDSIPEPEISATPAAPTPVDIDSADASIVAAKVQSTLQESEDVAKQIQEFEAAPATEPMSTAPPETTTTAPTVSDNYESTHTVDAAPARPEPTTTPAIVLEPAQTAAVSEPSVSQISGKLVIQPPNDHADEPDISALVAQEEYQEQTAAGLAGQPVVSPAPEVPATPEKPAEDTPSPGGVFMPNSGGSANDTAL